MTTWLMKADARAEGAELPIYNESHDIGADVPHVVILNELPLKTSPSTVSIQGYTEVDDAPSTADEFRVEYTGLHAGYIAFHPSATGSVTVSYLGRGSALFARDINRLQTAKADLDGSLPFTGQVAFAQGLVVPESRVGIGTTDPQTALDVRGTVAFNSGAYGQDMIRLHNPGDPDSFWRMQINGPTNLLLTSTQGSFISLRPDDGGMLGIGTTPIFPLDVQGTVRAYGWFRVTGAFGLYFETYGGGWQMTDMNYIRSYGDRSIYTGGDVLASKFTSVTNTAYFVEPANTGTAIKVAGGAEAKSVTIDNKVRMEFNATLNSLDFVFLG